jgi:ANTAR domain-containing protein
MVGRHDGADPLARVRAWVAERAGNRGAPVSVPLLCQAAVPRLGVSGVALVVDTAGGWPETRYSTDALAGRLAELQVTVGEGPCADAGRTGGPVLVSDLDTPVVQHRWPLFAPLAVEEGAFALFAFPLRVGSIRGGTLALHRTEAGPLDQAALTDSLAFGRLALVLLLDEQSGLRATDGLPLHDPAVHQATGMIAAQLDVGMAEAFASLRGRAFAARRPLGVLAADVVARRVRFDPTQETI